MNDFYVELLDYNDTSRTFDSSTKFVEFLCDNHYVRSTLDITYIVQCFDSGIVTEHNLTKLSRLLRDSGRAPYIKSIIFTGYKIKTHQGHLFAFGRKGLNTLLTCCGVSLKCIQSGAIYYTQGNSYEVRDAQFTM